MLRSAILMILLCRGLWASAETVYTVDCNGGGDFRTIQACFDALPSKPAEWRTVRIMPGTYREKVTLDVYKDKVVVVGCGKYPDDVRLVWDDHSGKVVDGRELTTYDSYTFSGQADDVLRLMRGEGFGELEILPDPAGIPRVVTGLRYREVYADA